MTNPLSYDSLYDPHLQTYFGNKHVRKHLRKVGLVNRHGEIVPYKEYEVALNEQSRQEHVRSLLSQGVVQRVIQLEKSRQANMRNQFEIVAKRMLVENVKESKQNYRQLRTTDLISIDRPTTSVTNNHLILVDRPRTSVANNNLIYQEQMKKDKETSSRVSSIRPTRLPKKVNSPPRNKTPRIIKANVNVKDLCRITMIYFGPQTIIDYNQSTNQTNDYEILIRQQHCGGENVIVFQNKVKPNEKFSFISRRHSEYPFALSLYVNGLIDCRISVCCEYKHKSGIPLGGKRASFAIVNVQGRQPCQTCRFNEYMANSPLFKAKSSEKSSICTDTSKYQTSDVSSSHRLLRTPSPYHDEQDDDTIVSNQNDEIKRAKEMYENISNKIVDDLSWEENGRLQYQLGNICKEGLADFEGALDHYLISLEIQCQHLSSIDIQIRNLYLSIGHILLLQGKTQNHLSIEYFQRVLDIDYSIGDINEYYLINDHYYLGLLYQNEQNYSQALFHFSKSLKYFSLINSNSKLIDQIYFNENENETIYDKKAFESLSLNKLPNLSEIHFNLAKTYLNIGQKQNAFKHAQKALQLTTSDQPQFDIYQTFLKKLR